MKFNERKGKMETLEYSLQKELRSKDGEINELLEQQKVLQTKKIKLKSIVKQKDEMIAELKHQCEELSVLNQNELLIS